MMWMLKNSKGKPDAMLSFAFGSFLVMIFCIIAPMFNGFKIGEFVWEVAKPDNTLLIGTLGASFVGYVTRRNTNDKIECNGAEKKDEVKNG